MNIFTLFASFFKCPKTERICPLERIFLKHLNRSVDFSMASFWMKNLQTDNGIPIIRYVSLCAIKTIENIPSVSFARPPVGWHKIVEHPAHTTTPWAWLKTVVILKQPGHLTSIKYDFGCCTKRFSLCFFFSSAGNGWSKSLASWNDDGEKTF